MRGETASHRPGVTTGPAVRQDVKVLPYKTGPGLRCVVLPGKDAVEAQDSADLELMERVRDGDTAAFTTLVGRYWKPLVAFAGDLLDDADAASDIVQEALLRLWDRRASWRPLASVKTYLFRLTRNLVIDEVRRRTVRDQWAVREQGMEHNQAATQNASVEQAEFRAAVQKAIQTLPLKRREALILAHVENLSYQQVAEVMGISPHTVARHISLALADLRSTLIAFGGSTEMD